LPPPIAGRLRVTVVAGKEFRLSKGMLGKSSVRPYLVLHLGNAETGIKTGEAKGEYDWNETLHLNIADKHRQQLYIQAFDKKMTGDSEIGDCVIPIDDVDRWFTLVNVETGQIQLKLQFIQVE